MTGLEKIILEIQQEAAAEAKAITGKANAQAEGIIEKAQQEAAAQVQKLEAEAAQEVKDVEAARESSIALQRRQRTLQVKQEVLRETLQKALESLYALPDKEYFELLLKLAAASAQRGKGEMMLNEKDKARMPAFFKLELAAKGLPEGAVLLVSNQTRPIDGGFVLKYGDIEENCSFKSIFEARQDEFSDLIRDVLFA